MELAKATLPIRGCQLQISYFWDMTRDYLEIKEIIPQSDIHNLLTEFVKTDHLLDEIEKELHTYLTQGIC